MAQSNRAVGDEMIDELFWQTALTWQGVPYQHQQATKWGCDCVGLLLGVAKQIGYDFSQYDIPHRPLTAINDSLKDQIKQIGIKHEDYDNLPNSSLLLFKIDQYIQHLAIYYRGQILHTNRRTENGVVLIDYPQYLHDRLRGVYLIDWSRAST
jgi:hypothetical protein